MEDEDNNELGRTFWVWFFLPTAASLLVGSIGLGFAFALPVLGLCIAGAIKCGKQLGEKWGKTEGGQTLLKSVCVILIFFFNLIASMAGCSAGESFHQSVVIQ